MQAQERRSRKKKKKKDSLGSTRKQLAVAAQSAAALALGLGLTAPGPAEGSIVHKDINVTIPDDTTFYNLDLNNDSNNDFSFYIFLNYPFNYPPYYNITLNKGPFIGGYNNNQMVGKTQLNYFFPTPFPILTISNLPEGTLIDNSINSYQTFIPYGFLAADASGDIYDVPFYLKAGEWIGKDGYVGLKFYDTDSNAHFGWVKLSVSGDLGTVSIFDCAYESTPDTGILAGAVPAPSSLLLLATGAAGVLAYRRRRKNKEKQPD